MPTRHQQASDGRVSGIGALGSRTSQRWGRLRPPGDPPHTHLAQRGQGLGQDHTDLLVREGEAEAG